VDPGSTCGLAALVPPARLVWSGEEQDRATAIAWVRYHRPEVVVVEDFKPYAGLPAWADLPAPRVIGALEELGLNVVRQPPGIKKQYPDLLLRAAGFLKPGKPHANDAVRHALHFAWMTLGHKKDPAVQEIYRRYIALVEELRPSREGTQGGDRA
jgi:hypothetical protein